MSLTPGSLTETVIQENINCPLIEYLQTDTDSLSYVLFYFIY